MKQNKIQIIGSIIIISILILMMANSILLPILSRILSKLNLSNNNSTNNTSYIADIKFENIYPFENVINKNKKISLIEKYKNIINKFENTLETHTSKELLGYQKMVELSYIYNDLMFYNLVSNSSTKSRIELENGYLSRLVEKRDVEQSSQKLIDFNTYLANRNIDLLYIQAPYKISKTQPISNIYHDYSNENMDKFLDYIYGKVKYIDLRKNIDESKFDYLKLFYKTDHHWLPETGLWATEVISKYLNDNYNMNLEIDNVNFNKYEIKKYPNMFLGADGRYVSLKNAKPETFDLITPNFDTKLSVKILDEGIDTTDTFENTLIDWSRIEYGNYYTLNTYAAYAYGDRPLIEIHNELVRNNKKILLIKDSFSEVVTPFLALENEYLSVIDLRHFDGSLKSYIDEFNPNIVMIMYNGDMVGYVNDTFALDDPDSAKDIEQMWNFE